VLGRVWYLPDLNGIQVQDVEAVHVECEKLLRAFDVDPAVPLPRRTSLWTAPPMSEAEFVSRSHVKVFRVTYLQPPAGERVKFEGSARWRPDMLRREIPDDPE